MAGTTDNGIVTFVNSGSTFAAEANLTFDGTTFTLANASCRQVLVPNGAVAKPGIAAAADTDTGVYFDGSNTMDLSVGGNLAHRWDLGGSCIIYSLEYGLAQFSDGSAGSPGITFRCDSDIGLFRAGANQVGVATSGAEIARFVTTQGFYIKGDCSGFGGGLLQVDKGSNDTPAIEFKSSDICQNFTSCCISAESFGNIGKYDGATGGLRVWAFGESDIGFQLRAISPTDTTTKAASGGKGRINLRVDKNCGSGQTAPGSDANLVAIAHGGTYRFIFDVEGTAHADVGTATYDDYCDVEVLRGFLGQTVDGYKENYQDRFGKDLMYNLCFYEENKLIGKDSIWWETRPCGKVEQRAMVNFTGLTMLHHSTIIQLADRVDARLTAIENKIALQGGK